MNIILIAIFLIPYKPNVIVEELYSTPHDYDILSYNLNLWIDMQAETLGGFNEVIFQSTKNSLDKITLHLHRNLKVHAVGNSSDFLHNISGRLIIYLSTPLDSGEIDTVKIFYSGQPALTGSDRLGFRFYSSMNLAYSFTEPNGARNWFPCFDEPDEKAKVSFHIKVLDTFVVASNGVLDSVSVIADTLIYHWRTEYDISTYLMAISIYPYDTIINYWNGMPIINFVYPEDTSNAKIAFGNVPEMLTFLSNKFGYYPFSSEKYGHAEVSYFGGAMEHATITMMGDFLVSNPTAYYVEYVVLHELSHHWFGNSVTCKEWADIWLNEGFASYCEALWDEYKNGYSSYLDYIHGFQNVVLNSDLEWQYSVYNPPSQYLFKELSYDKGACILHMLRFQVNNDTLFFNALRDYHLAFKYKNATTEDLKNFLMQRLGMDLNKFFDQWVYKVGHPIIEWTYYFSNDTLYVRLKQTQDTSIYNTSIFEFPVEIAVVDSNLDTTYVRVVDSLKFQTFSIFTGFAPYDVLLDPKGHILMEKKYVGIEEKPVVKRRDNIILALQDGKFYIKTKGKAEVYVYEVDGRKILQDKFFNQKFIRFKNSGVYIIKIKNRYTERTYKIWNLR